jgi:hypothetical protein
VAGADGGGTGAGVVGVGVVGVVSGVAGGVTGIRIGTSCAMAIGVQDEQSSSPLAKKALKVRLITD